MGDANNKGRAGYPPIEKQIKEEKRIMVIV